MKYDNLNRPVPMMDEPGLARYTEKLPQRVSIGQPRFDPEVDAALIAYYVERGRELRSRSIAMAVKRAVKWAVRSLYPGGSAKVRTVSNVDPRLVDDGRSPCHG